MVGIAISNPIINNMQTHSYDIYKVDIALADALVTIAKSMILFGNNSDSDNLARVVESYPTDDVFTIESVQHIKSECDAVIEILMSQNTPADTAIMATVGIVGATAGIALQELNRVAVFN